MKSKIEVIVDYHFDIPFDTNITALATNVLERMNFEAEDLCEELSYCMDDELIYYEDQWTIAKYYATSPKDLDWNDALYEFEQELYDIVADIVNPDSEANKYYERYYKEKAI